MPQLCKLCRLCKFFKHFLVLLKHLLLEIANNKHENLLLEAITAAGQLTTTANIVWRRLLRTAATVEYRRGTAWHILPQITIAVCKTALGLILAEALIEKFAALSLVIVDLQTCPS